MIKAIIFDYDGVIVDSFPAVHKTYQAICKKLGKKCPSSLAQFRKTYGKRSKECMHNLGFDTQEVDKANHLYVEEIGKEDTPLFSGILEVIKKLCKEYPLFLISASPRTEIVQKLKNADLNHYFTEIIAGTIGSMEKVPELRKLLKRQGLKPDEALMIGDRINDYEDAINVGIKKIILVEYGWGYDKKAIPEHTQKVKVEKPKDILKAIKSVL